MRSFDIKIWFFVAFSFASVHFGHPILDMPAFGLGPKAELDKSQQKAGIVRPMSVREAGPLSPSQHGNGRPQLLSIPSEVRRDLLPPWLHRGFRWRPFGMFGMPVTPAFLP